MRIGPALTCAALAAPLALTACPGSGGSSGKGAGDACQSAGECGSGLFCYQSHCASGYDPSPTCTPPGSPQLADGGVVAAVDPGPGACVTTARAPVTFPAADVVDLGQKTVGTTLTFDIPQNTAGFMLFAQDARNPPDLGSFVYQGFQYPNTPAPTNVQLPGGALFYSDTAALPQDSGGYDDTTQLLAFFSGPSPVAGAFGVPNTASGLDLVRTQGQVPPGTWTFTVNDWSYECTQLPGCSGGKTTGLYQLHLVRKSGPLRSTGTLDIDVYLATDPALSQLSHSADAVANPQVARFVRSLSTYLGGGGICVGTVTFRDVPDWARSRYAPNGIIDVSSTGPCSALDQLFTVSVAPSSGVHLFLADDLMDTTTPSGTSVLGIDGSIPGPSGFPGTINSGAVAGRIDLLGFEFTAGACSSSSPTLQCGTDLVAYISAHEIGHWLGLYHVTEAFGTAFDTLSDTPRCPCLSCAPLPERSSCAERGTANQPYLMGAIDCVHGSCAGGEDLMFWLLSRTYSKGALSGQQGEVMRLNPAVH